MSEDLYAKLDLTKKVRFQTGKKEDRNNDDEDTTNSATIYDNYLPEESIPQKSQDNTTGDQQQTASVSDGSGKKNLCRAAAVFLGLLCLVLLVAVIVLVVQLIQGIQDKKHLVMARNRLLVDNTNLSSERDKLKTSYSEMESLNDNLTQQTSQLKKKINFMMAINNNLTTERDELKELIDKNWAKCREVCENHDAQLVIISSAEEQKLFNSFGLAMWIGLTDEEKEDEWRWVNGSLVTATYWGKNQPDNYGWKGEDCAVISTTHTSGTMNTWNDLPCSSTSRCVCEKVP